MTIKHEQLLSMVNQLMEERAILYCENEYLKAKLNESILIETIHDMKKERSILLNLLSSLTLTNGQHNSSTQVKHHMKESETNHVSSSPSSASNNKAAHYNSSLVQKNSIFIRHNPSVNVKQNWVHRPKIHDEYQQQKPTIYRIENIKENSISHPARLSSSATNRMNYPQPNRKMFVDENPTILPKQESTKPMRKPDVQLKHSQNSPFQHYRSQSLQDLT